MNSQYYNNHNIGFSTEEPYYFYMTEPPVSIPVPGASIR